MAKLREREDFQPGIGLAAFHCPVGNHGYGIFLNRIKVVERSSQ